MSSRQDAFAAGQGKRANGTDLSGNTNWMSIFAARKNIHILIITTVRLLELIVRHVKSLYSIIPYFCKIYFNIIFLATNVSTNLHSRGITRNFRLLGGGKRILREVKTVC